MHHHHMVNALSERRTACYRRTGVIVSLCKASDLSHFARLHVVKLCPGVPVSKKTCMQQNILRCSKIALRCSSDRRNLHCHKALSPMGLLRGVIDSVSAKLAFFPPSPPSYEVKGHGDRPDELYISPMFPDIRQVLNCEVLHVKTKPHRGGGGNTTIVVAWVPYHSVVPTMLFSHGNAVDLGQMLPFYRELSKELRINVLGYDYSGYGCSTGTPSVSNTIADINACYQFLLQVKGKRPQDIVVYGQSVGSGPTCDLGASEKGLRGIVLHSPLMSGMRVLSPSMNRWPGWMDIFPNITLLPKVEAKTLIMHGDKDEVVPCEHGKALHKAAKNPYPPLWASGFGHQNLEFCTLYLPKLQEFLRDLFGKDYGKM